MSTSYNAQVRDRLKEEIDRYRVGKSVYPTEDEMSLAIGRNAQFIRNFMSKPDRHRLRASDLYQLDKLFNLDILYIITSKRTKS